MRKVALAAFLALVALGNPVSVVGDDPLVRGTASTYGDGYEGYLALPTRLGGRGEHVRICSTKTGRCITRTSNDTGPVARLHRVADLDASDFNFLCACDWHTKGVQEVTIKFLDRQGTSKAAPPSVRVTPPPTDVGG